MLARFRKAMDEREEGFTLIELLVVMIIIGILAAIAIPVFLSQKNKAKDTSIKSDVSVIGKDVASYYVDNTGALTASGSAGAFKIVDAASATVDTGKLSTGNKVLTSKIVDDSNWCVSVSNSATGTTIWNYSASNGLTKGDCP